MSFVKCRAVINCAMCLENTDHNDILPCHISVYFRAESQMFKARFIGWDDVLAVDYTLSADYVSKAAKQLGVTVRMGFVLLFQSYPVYFVWMEFRIENYRIRLFCVVYNLGQVIN